MQPPAPTQSSPAFSGFAGLLATLASPPPEDKTDAPLWSTSDLGEDVATLSYERALRAHARYRPANRSATRDAAFDDPALLSTRAAETPIAADELLAAPALQAAALPDRNLRNASVTIRLSKAECAQLHQRAAEAGLTVSGYLRSCALEAEALRAQVKQALAELKAGNKGAREQDSMRANPHGSKGVTLTRVLAHMGRLCVGLASGKSA